MGLRPESPAFITSTAQKRRGREAGKKLPRLCLERSPSKLRGEKEIEMWGDGEQRRSFIYVSDVVKGLVSLMESDYSGPVNIGNDYTVSINELGQMLSEIAEYPVTFKHVSGAQGVRGRNSDNTLARKVLPEWKPEVGLREGLTITYKWIEQQVNEAYYTGTLKVCEAVAQ